ncbi:MAG: tetratricopeptide repeat protein [Polyangiaceae bacterium]|jgi:tetratricopeptide (TPR) repeat protein
MRVFLAAVFLAVGLAVPRAGTAQESQIEGLRAVAQSHSRDWEAALSLGRALRRAGRWAQAEVELRRGIGVCAANPSALRALYTELARVYMDLGNVQRAFATCKQLIHVPGASAEGHACVANAHLVWQRATEAQLEAAEALAIDPQCYNARLAQGLAFEFELDSARAEASFREAIAMRPDGADARTALGRVLWRAGDRSQGLAELSKGVELDPLGPENVFELASALPLGPERTGLLERAVRERPSFGKAWLELGAQRLASGRVAEAKEAAESAARTDATNLGARVLLGQVALAEGRADDAIHAGEAALKSEANNAAAELLVADGNARKGEMDLAIEAYQAAWGLDHRDPTPLVSASLACHAVGRDTSARAFGVRASEEFPDWGPAWAALGDALVAQNEQRAAREAYGRALSASAGGLDRDGVRAKLAAMR